MKVFILWLYGKNIVRNNFTQLLKDGCTGIDEIKLIFISRQNFGTTNISMVNESDIQNKI